MNEKKRNIPLGDLGGKKTRGHEDLFYSQDDPSGMNSSLASMETLDAFVGPVKAEF